MTIIIDPEETETAILLDFTGDLKGKLVLEIGSGDGRMTRRFAQMARRVTGLEPKLEDNLKAIQELPASLENKVKFLNQNLEGFYDEWQAGPQPEPFDLVILSWSL